MSWRDRPYNPGRDEVSSYFADPASLLQLSLPLYQSPGLSIRIHFWFLIYAIFRIADILHFREPAYYIPIDLALLLAAVLFHEWGHRVFARQVGGDHRDWTVWPLGGMVPPAAPRGAWPTFVANIGGNVFSLGLAIVAGAGLLFLVHGEVAWSFRWWDLFSPFLVSAAQVSPVGLEILSHSLGVLIMASIAIVIINFFPAYWFDGGYLWQSILTPRFGSWKATLITCIACMVLSIPFIVISIFHQDFLGLAVWALLFASGYSRRKSLLAAVPGVMDEEEGSYQYLSPENPKRKRIKKRWADAARKRAKMEQAEQALIDAILAKVKEKGLHSLSWGEKRALRKATARQRERDLASRR